MDGWKNEEMHACKDGGMNKGCMHDKGLMNRKICESRDGGKTWMSEQMHKLRHG
jgi:hypothetical protein